MVFRKFVKSEVICSVVHTPADWTPTELFLIGKMVKTLNLEAGLPNFVLLVGTGFQLRVVN
jgi:hypothetical protein